MRGRLAIGALAALCVAGLSVAASAEPLRLYAAGSLKAALGDVAAAFTQAYGVEVETTFGASGLLRERIEGGETAHLFASANMKHPRSLMAAGRGGPVVLFARNRLCALAQGALPVSSGGLLETMLSPKVRLGTSTPRADPSGDYAWALFEKAEALQPGAYAALDGKALKLTGGPDSPKAPEGQNLYAWVMEQDQADLFLTYCTNAVLAKRQLSSLQIVDIPAALSVGADYGLMVFKDAPPEASRLALYILSPEGQRILADYGFASGAPPADGK